MDKTGPAQPTGSQLVGIFYRQYERRCLLQLSKAFRRWKEEYPLVNKCDELNKQLRERLLALDSVRASYMKDVVAIKQHIHTLSGLDPYLDIEKYKAALFDVEHNLPSLDFRSIINCAKSGWNESTSSYLRETLIACGIVDPETGKSFNGWEKSAAFKRTMRLRSAGTRNNFDTQGGECITLAAPRDSKLFVRYCKECIGVMSIVKSWNVEVEALLRQNIDNVKGNDKIQELRKLVDSMQEMALSQEEKVRSLTHRNNELEEANAWFENWKTVVNARQQESVVDDLRRVVAANVAMAMEDKAAALYRAESRFTQQENEYIQRIRELRAQSQLAKTERERESEARLRLADELQRTQRERNALRVDLSAMQSLREQEAQHTLRLEQLLDKAHQENNRLLSALESMGSEFAAYREEMKNQLENTESELARTLKLLEKKEEECDAQRDELRGKQMALAQLSAELSSYQDDYDALQSRLNNMIAAKEEAERLRLRKKRTLRGVVFVVIATLRIVKTAKDKNFLRLGAIGMTIVVRHQQQQIEDLLDAQREAKGTTRDLELAVREADRDRQSLQKSLNDLTNKNINLQKETQELRATVYQQEQSLRQLRSAMDVLRKQLEDELQRNANSICLRPEDRERVASRIKVLMRWQRDTCESTQSVLMQVRGSAQSWKLKDTMMSMQAVRRNVSQWIDMGDGVIGNGIPLAPTPIDVSRKSKRLLWNTVRNFTSQLSSWFVNERKLSTQTYVSTDRSDCAFWACIPIDERDTRKSGNLLLTDVSRDQKAGESRKAIILQRRVSELMKEGKAHTRKLSRDVQTDLEDIDNFIALCKEMFAEWKRYFDLLATAGIKSSSPAESVVVPPAMIPKQMSISSNTTGRSRRKSVARTGMSKESIRLTSQSRKQLNKMRSDLHHMLDTDVSSYLSNVLGAIENVQEEFGAMYSAARNSIFTRSTSSRNILGSVEGLSPQRRTSVSEPESRRLTPQSSQRSLPIASIAAQMQPPPLTSQRSHKTLSQKSTPFSSPPRPVPSTDAAESSSKAPAATASEAPESSKASIGTYRTQSQHSSLSSTEGKEGNEYQSDNALLSLESNALDSNPSSRPSSRLPSIAAATAAGIAMFPVIEESTSLSTGTGTALPTLQRQSSRIPTERSLLTASFESPEEVIALESPSALRPTAMLHAQLSSSSLIVTPPPLTPQLSSRSLSESNLRCDVGDSNEHIVKESIMSVTVPTNANLTVDAVAAAAIPNVENASARIALPRVHSIDDEMEDDCFRDISLNDLQQLSTTESLDDGIPIISAQSSTYEISSVDSANAHNAVKFTKPPMQRWASTGSQLYGIEETASVESDSCSELLRIASNGLELAPSSTPGRLSPNSHNELASIGSGGSFDTLQENEETDANELEDAHDDFAEELDTMKKEMIMFMNHEQSLKSQISTLTAEKESFLYQESVLNKTIARLESSQEMLTKEHKDMKSQLKSIIVDYEKTLKENGLLREMIEEGYRHFANEKESMLRSMEEFVRHRGRNYSMRDQETQVQCAPCELLAILHGKAAVDGNDHQHHHGHAFPSATAFSQRRAILADGAPRDEDTIGTAHKGLAVALGAPVVLIPRDRCTSRNTIAATDAAQRSPMMPAKPSEDELSTASSLTDREQLLKHLDRFRDDFDRFVSNSAKEAKPVDSKSARGDGGSEASKLRALSGLELPVDDRFFEHRDSLTSDYPMLVLKNLSLLEESIASMEKKRFPQAVPLSASDMATGAALVTNNNSNNKSLTAGSGGGVLSEMGMPALRVSTNKLHHVPSPTVRSPVATPQPQSQLQQQIGETLRSRPLSATASMLQSSAPVANTKERPKSGHQFRSSAADGSLDASKFRKIRQFPNGTSQSAMIGSQSAKQLSSSAMFVDSSVLPTSSHPQLRSSQTAVNPVANVANPSSRPLSATAAVRKLLGKHQQPSSVNAAAAAADALKIEQRTVSNTAAYLQYHMPHVRSQGLTFTDDDSFDFHEFQES